MSDSGVGSNGSGSKSLRLRAYARYAGYAALILAIITLFQFIQGGEILSPTFAGTWIFIALAFGLRAMAGKAKADDDDGEGGDDGT